MKTRLPFPATLPFRAVPFKEYPGAVSHALLACSLLAAPALPAGLTRQTYPAGQLLKYWNDGGRLAAYHGGRLYQVGMSKSFVWDISDPRNPVQEATGTGGNGHRWAKFGPALWKEYFSYDGGDRGFHFLDLRALPRFVPYQGAAPAIPFQGDEPAVTSVWTFPHQETGRGLADMRTGAAIAGSVRPSSLKTVNSANPLRIGNLWFYCPGDEQAGVAVIDAGNPANPKLVSELKGDIRQYTTIYQVWRNYIILLIGDDTNSGGNNLIAIDFDDPANLKVAWGMPNSVLKGMRYMFFQDEFGFGGRQGEGLKIDMVSRKVVQRFPITGGFGGDFQWIPLGHLLVQTGSEDCEGCASQTHIFSHMDSLDRRAPEVGYHLPKDGAVNQPLGTVVGLVIAESLDDTSVTDRNVIIRPVGGQPVAADVVHYSYNVVNIAPRSPLLANTSYEVEVVAGGIKDVAGNGINGRKFHFATGPTLTRPGAGVAAKPRPPGLLAQVRGRSLALAADFPGPYRVEAADPGGRVHTVVSTRENRILLSMADWGRGLHAVTVTGAGGRKARRRVLAP